MKKLISVALILAMTLALPSCNNTDYVNDNVTPEFFFPPVGFKSEMNEEELKKMLDNHFSVTPEEFMTETETSKFLNLLYDTGKLFKENNIEISVKFINSKNTGLSYLVMINDANFEQILDVYEEIKSTFVEKYGSSYSEKEKWEEPTNINALKPILEAIKDGDYTKRTLWSVRENFDYDYVSVHLSHDMVYIAYA